MNANNNWSIKNTPHLRLTIYAMYVVLAVETGELDADPVVAATAVVRDNRDVRVWDLSTESDALVDFLYEHAAANVPVVTFNGTGFGFQKLSGVAKNKDRVETLALLTRDIFLDWATENGYFVSLNSFLSGCGLPGKGTAATNDYDTLAAASTRTVNCISNLVDYYTTHKKVYRLSKAGKKSLWQPRGTLFRVAHKCIEEYEHNPVTVDWITNKPNICAIWSWI